MKVEEQNWREALQEEWRGRQDSTPKAKQDCVGKEAQHLGAEPRHRPRVLSSLWFQRHLPHTGEGGGEQWGHSNPHHCGPGTS
jgi:hypothetical protein